MELIKHVGKLKELDTKVLVVFMSLPEKPSHALVIAVHTLPDLMHDEIMSLLKTEECQKEKDLGVFLNRKTFNGGNGASILSWLHNSGKLISVPTESVIMLPHPGHPMPLNELLDMMGTQTDAAKTLIKAETDEEKKAVAENLLIEAEMLREEASKKEAQAHVLLGKEMTKKPRAKKKKTEAAE
jgi:hypothetical protein